MRKKMQNIFFVEKIKIKISTVTDCVGGVFTFIAFFEVLQVMKLTKIVFL